MGTINRLAALKKVNGVESVTATMVQAGHMLTGYMILVWTTTFIVELLTGRAIVIDSNFYTFMTFAITTLYGGRPLQMGFQYFGQKVSEWTRKPKDDHEPEVKPKPTAKPKPESKPKPKPTSGNQQEKFVVDTIGYARAAEKADGISAVLRIAQAALESNWGKSAIGNNLFGITAGASWKGAKVMKTTTEYHDQKNVKYPEVLSVEWSDARGMYKYRVKRYFRDYPNLTEAFIDHGRVLQQKQYKAAQPYKKDPYRFAEAIQSGKQKYATSNKYVPALHKVIEQVQQIIQKLGV